MIKQMKKKNNEDTTNENEIIGESKSEKMLNCLKAMNKTRSLLNGFQKKIQSLTLLNLNIAQKFNAILDM